VNIIMLIVWAAGESTHPSKKTYAQATLIIFVVAMALGIVIAILAAMLLPALSSAKDRAWVVNCLNNQKQLALTIHLYSADNTDYMPPSSDYQGVAQYGGGYWPGPIPGIAGNQTVQQAIAAVQEGLKKGPIFPYCPNTASYHCPADKRFKNRRPGLHWAYDSYSKVDGINGGMWDVPPVKKLSSLKDPSRALAFVEEADSRNYNQGTWVMNVKDHAWVDPLAIFHGIQSGISMADGHAEAHKWLEDTTINTASAAQRNLDTPFYWAKKTPRDRDFLWVEPRYKYESWPQYLGYPF
jgi:hypothetical protein